MPGGYGGKVGSPELIHIAITIFIFLFILGVAYAWQIELAPSPHGWTWISVVVGDAFTDIAMATVLFVGLIYFYGLEEALRGWWLITVPVAAHLTSGIPMIGGQLLKRRSDYKRSKLIATGTVGIRSPFKIPETPDISPETSGTPYGKEK